MNIYIQTNIVFQKSYDNKFIEVGLYLFHQTEMYFRSVTSLQHPSITYPDISLNQLNDNQLFAYSQNQELGLTSLVECEHCAVVSLNINGSSQVK